MNRAAAWSVRGVGRETLDIAEEAARRAGMSLGDWLDEVVAEQAADQGISVDDLDEDDKLDAIGDRLSRLSRHAAAVRRDAGEERRAPRPEPKRSGEEARRALDSLEAAADHRDDLDDPIGDRLSRLSRHERAPVAARRDAGEDKRTARPERNRPGEEARRTQDLLETAEDERDDDKLDAIADRLSRLSSRERPMAANRPDAGNDAPDPRPEPKPSVEDARREQELLEAAVAKFETRAAKSEERTAKAFESVASWIEQSQAERAQERATLQSVAQKLTDIEQRSVHEVERSPAGPSRAGPRAPRIRRAVPARKTSCRVRK
jgi:localization factor PodJL